jgi:hypothetical protein
MKTSAVEFKMKVLLWNPDTNFTMKVKQEEVDKYKLQGFDDVGYEWER